jgi:hypothetical protein
MPLRDQAEVATRMAPAPLPLPLLCGRYHGPHRHRLGVELVRRDFLGRHPDLGRALALGDPEGVVGRSAVSSHLPPARVNCARRPAVTHWRRFIHI